MTGLEKTKDLTRTENTEPKTKDLARTENTENTERTQSKKAWIEKRKTRFEQMLEGTVY